MRKLLAFPIPLILLAAGAILIIADARHGMPFSKGPILGGSVLIVIGLAWIWEDYIRPLIRKR